MTLVQRFAQVFGIIYLLVGVLGFVPPLLSGSFDDISGPFSGVLLSLFAVNWFHSLVHLVIGAVGLAVHRSFSGSKTYALAVGVIYAALFLLGMSGSGLQTLGGLLPLNWLDDVLHLLTALVAFGAYFFSRSPEAGRGATQSHA